MLRNIDGKGCVGVLLGFTLSSYLSVTLYQMSVVLAFKSKHWCQEDKQTLQHLIACNIARLLQIKQSMSKYYWCTYFSALLFYLFFN